MKGKATAFAIVAVLCLGVAPASSTAPVAAAKKKCKVVVKKVHGKKRKVRVCPKGKTLPASVSVTLDRAHAAAAPISPDAGGTVKTGRATLSFPADAVVSTTKVTVTPVTHVGGLSGSVLGAVQLEPEGLQLLKPVTLTIDVSSTSGLKAFSYAGTGRDFHLYPLKLAGGKATLELFHFSGYGVGKGLPSPAVQRLRDRLNSLVELKVLQAETHSGVFEEALGVYLGWLHDVNGLPGDEAGKFARDVARLEASLAKGMKNFVDDYIDDCVNSHDLNVIPKVMSAAGGYAATLASRPGGFADAYDYAKNKALKCTTFELDFETTLTQDFKQVEDTETSHKLSTSTQTAHFGAKSVRLQAVVSGLGGGSGGTAPLEVLGFDYTFNSEQTPKQNGFHIVCSASASASNALPAISFRAAELKITLGDPPAIALEFDPGEVDAIATGQCVIHPPENCGICVDTFTPVKQQLATGGEWPLLHGNESGVHGYPVKNWTHLGGSTWARKTTTSNPVKMGDFTYTDKTTTFVLRHTPQP
ncbi:MAG TPA: hypothetical protein VF895_01810 [Gaiellaceae bacterium]